MKMIGIVLLAMLLCACATPVRTWTRSDANPSGIAQDQAQCQYQARAATASYHSTPSARDDTQGMGNAVGDGVVIAEKQIDLTNDCMRAKGYVGL